MINLIFSELKRRQKAEQKLKEKAEKEATKKEEVKEAKKESIGNEISEENISPNVCIFKLSMMSLTCTFAIY